MRKPIQIEIMGTEQTKTVVALCDDGTIWVIEALGGKTLATVQNSAWVKLPLVTGQGAPLTD